jgi:hypothetical protein
MTGLINLQDALDPCDDLVRGWVGWLIKIDDSVSLELIERSGSWGPSTR